MLSLPNYSLGYFLSCCCSRRNIDFGTAQSILRYEVFFLKKKNTRTGGTHETKHKRTDGERMNEWTPATGLFRKCLTWLLLLSSSFRLCIVVVHCCVYRHVSNCCRPTKQAAKKRLSFWLVFHHHHRVRRRRHTRDRPVTRPTWMKKEEEENSFSFFWFPFGLSLLLFRQSKRQHDPDASYRQTKMGESSYNW